MSAPILKVCPELNEAQLQLLYRELIGRLPGKKSLAEKAVFNHYHGRPCSFMGYETNPTQLGHNGALKEVDTAIREFLGIEDEV